jgi:hypothetical protein
MQQIHQWLLLITTCPLKDLAVNVFFSSPFLSGWVFRFLSFLFFLGVTPFSLILDSRKKV